MPPHSSGWGVLGWSKKENSTKEHDPQKRYLTLGSWSLPLRFSPGERLLDGCPLFSGRSRLLLGILGVPNGWASNSRVNSQSGKDGGSQWCGMGGNNLLSKNWVVLTMGWFYSEESVVTYTNSTTLTIGSVPSLKADVEGVGVRLESIKRHEEDIGFQSRGVVWKVWWGWMTNGTSLYMAQPGYSSSLFSHTAQVIRFGHWSWTTT